MSLITIISIILIVLATSDFLLSNMPRLQNDIFKVSFFLTYFLFTIKYYYGPDINQYVPNYIETESLTYAFNHLSNLQFESGYNLFCGLLRSLGCSFWCMTAVISTIYFGAIYALFKQLKSKKTFALMILVVLDNALMYAALRQSLSIACFIFMILALQKKDYLATIVCAVLSILFHKSAMFVIPPTLLIFAITNSNLKQYTFELLLLLLCVLVVVPLINIINPVIELLPLSTAIKKSIEHHLLLGRAVQVVFLLYFVALLCINYFNANNSSRNDIIKISVVVGFIFIVCFYQYYYVLNRIRSFFIPLILLYTINQTHQYFQNKSLSIPYSKIIKQLSVLFIFVYVTFLTYTQENSFRQTVSQIHDCTTIFDLLRYDKNTLQQRQLKKAKTFWDRDFMSETNNLIDKSHD